MTEAAKFAVHMLVLPMYMKWDRAALISVVAPVTLSLVLKNDLDYTTRLGQWFMNLGTS